MTMLEELLRDFRAEGEVEIAILRRLRAFLVNHGELALGSEIAGEIGHVTASAWIANSQNTRVLLVFGRKANRWQLPGAHGEGDLIAVARIEAARALGCALATRNPPLWALAEREIAPYWNTPAHRHFELIFRFEEAENGELPRGAKWFWPEESARLDDATLGRLARKR